MLSQAAFGQMIEDPRLEFRPIGRSDSTYRILKVLAMRSQSAGFAFAAMGADKREVSDILSTIAKVPEEFQRHAVNHDPATPVHKAFNTLPSVRRLRSVLRTVLTRHSQRQHVSITTSIVTMHRYLQHIAVLRSQVCSLDDDMTAFHAADASDFQDIVDNERRVCGASLRNSGLQAFSPNSVTAGEGVRGSLEACFNQYFETVDDKMSCENPLAEGSATGDEGKEPETESELEGKRKDKEDLEARKQALQQEDQQLEEESANASLSPEEQESINERRQEIDEEINDIDADLAQVNSEIDDLEEREFREKAETESAVSRLMPLHVFTSGFGQSAYRVDWRELRDDANLNRGPHDCFSETLAFGLGSGVRAGLALSASRSNQHGLGTASESIRRPPGLFEVLDNCLCEAFSPFEGQSALPGGKGPKIDLCLSHEDKQRLDCIASFYGPDDAPRPECVDILEGDNDAWAEYLVDKGCELMLCPEGSSAVSLDPNLYGECAACASQTGVAERIPGSGCCAAMECAPEQWCVSDGVGCACNSEPFVATTTPKAILLAPEIGAPVMPNEGPTLLTLLSPVSAQLGLSVTKMTDEPVMLTVKIPEVTSTKVTVFDDAGKPLRALVDGTLPSGEYNIRWDLKDDLGTTVTPGSYYIILATGERRVVRAIDL